MADNAKNGLGPKVFGVVQSSNTVRGPTLLRIWEDFIKDGHSRADSIAAEELCSRWSRAASALRLDAYCDSSTMAKCVSHIAPYICQDQATNAGMDRWLHALLCCCAGGQARACARRLQAMIDAPMRDRQAHHAFRKELEEKGFGREGRQKVKVLLTACCEKAMHESAALEAGSQNQGLNSDIMVSQALEAFGFNGNELITYPQLLALCFGRFEVCVTLHMYDLSQGRAVGWTSVDGIWHTGVVAFGREYFYNGRPVLDKPGESDFGQVGKTLHLGWTLRKQDELHGFVIEELQSKFDLEQYDILHNNCNHFSNEILGFLLGTNLPDDILHQEEILFKLPGMRMIWPLFRGMVNSCNADSRKHASLICDSQNSGGIVVTADDVGGPALAAGLVSEPPPPEEPVAREYSECGELVEPTVSTECSSGNTDLHSMRELPGTHDEIFGTLQLSMEKDIESLLKMTRERNAEPVKQAETKTQGNGTPRRSSFSMLRSMFASKSSSN